MRQPQRPRTAPPNPSAAQTLIVYSPWESPSHPAGSVQNSGLAITWGKEQAKDNVPQRAECSLHVGQDRADTMRSEMLPPQSSQVTPPQDSVLLTTA